MYVIAALLWLAQDEVLQQAVRAAQDYMAMLPDFVCRQTTTRQLRFPRRTKLELIDVISAEVAVSGGFEEYRWILRNGIPVDGDSGLWRTGLWTRGEWSTVLKNSMDPEMEARYTALGPVKTDSFRGHRYEFRVEQSNSRWQVAAPGRNVFPAYRGQVYIDGASGRAVHVEMTADEFPADFPIRYASVSVDYGWVSILGRRYLLPVKAMTANCERTRGICSVNTIQFFGHRKFEAESRLVAEGEATLDIARDPVLAAVWPVAQREARKAHGRRYYRTVLTGESREIDAYWKPATRERQVVEFEGLQDRPLRSKANAPTAFTDYLTTLSTIFNPAIQAEFSDGGVYVVEPAPVRIYFFSVPRERSQWLLLKDGQMLSPAYRGVLLVEAKTSRVHTLSLRTQELPSPFPLRRAEKTFLFHPPGAPYRNDPAPAHAAELEYPRDRGSARRLETHYAPLRR